MIVLDTNVVSELMNPQGSQAVKSWADSQARESLFTTTITQAEILYGIAILPEGNRKQRLQAAARIVFNEEFLNQILLFDSASAGYFAAIAAYCRKQGFPSPSLMPKLLPSARRIKPRSPLAMWMISLIAA